MLGLTLWLPTGGSKRPGIIALLALASIVITPVIPAKQSGALGLGHAIAFIERLPRPIRLLEFGMIGAYLDSASMTVRNGRDEIKTFDRWLREEKINLVFIENEERVPLHLGADFVWQQFLLQPSNFGFEEKPFGVGRIFLKRP